MGVIQEINKKRKAEVAEYGQTTAPVVGQYIQNLQIDFDKDGEFDSIGSPAWDDAKAIAHMQERYDAGDPQALMVLPSMKSSSNYSRLNFQHAATLQHQKEQRERIQAIFETGMVGDIPLDQFNSDQHTTALTNLLMPSEALMAYMTPNARNNLYSEIQEKVNQLASKIENWAAANKDNKIVNNLSQVPFAYTIDLDIGLLPIVEQKLTENVELFNINMLPVKTVTKDDVIHLGQDDALKQMSNEWLRRIEDEVFENGLNLQKAYQIYQKALTTATGLGNL